MQRSLILSALRALEKNGPFTPAKLLDEFLRDNNIGRRVGAKVALGPAAKDSIWRILQSDHGVVPGTSPEAWSATRTRSEALSLSTNEKHTTRRVRQDRVAVKALAGQPVMIGGETYPLPPGVSLDISVQDAASLRGHRAIVLVENWEAFECIHRVSFPFPDDLQDALLVYRGEKSGYSTGAAKAFLKEINLPVHVFSDPDPAGLLIALTAVNFAGLAFPPASLIETMIAAGRGDRRRYIEQLPQCERILDDCPRPDIQTYWRILKSAGIAIPQEEFVRSTQH